MTHTQPTWITNDPTVAEKLRAADKAFAEAGQAAQGLPLAEKLAAFNTARVAKLAAYRSAIATRSES